MRWLVLIYACLVGCSSDPTDVGADAGAEDTSARDASADANTSDTSSFDTGETDSGTPDAGFSPPASLTRYFTGNAADREVTPLGPALVLMGGGAEVDDAFHWWRSLIVGGDVVILRASGSDGYNDYLYQEIGGCDSVETLLVTSRALADHGYVSQTVLNAEGLFIAGGDQSVYLDAWKDSALEDALQAAWDRGAVLGGTSAGLAVLGEQIFAAHEGTVTSNQALSDPYHQRVSLDEGFLALPPLSGIITDTHFAERDRMGRLVTFLARLITDGETPPLYGLGLDPRTAIVIGADQKGQVMGSGHAYLVYGEVAPAVCSSGTPLTYENVPYQRFSDGDTLDFSARPFSQASLVLSVAQGILQPTDPY